MELGLLNLFESNLNILETLLALRLGLHKTRSVLQVLRAEGIASGTESLANIICTFGDEPNDLTLDGSGASLGEVSEALTGLSHYGTLLIHIGLACRDLVVTDSGGGAKIEFTEMTRLSCRPIGEK